MSYLWTGPGNAQTLRRDSAVVNQSVAASVSSTYSFMILTSIFGTRRATDLVWGKSSKLQTTHGSSHTRSSIFSDLQQLEVLLRLLTAAMYVQPNDHFGASTYVRGSKTY